MGSQEHTSSSLCITCERNLVWWVQVAANQLILGPIVITLVFAWNKLWEGHLEQLPNLYRTRALPTLIDGESKHSQFQNMFHDNYLEY